MITTDTYPMILTVWFHASFQTLVIPAHLADVARLPRDHAAAVVVALVLETVPFFYRSTEKTLATRPNQLLFSTENVSI